MKPFITLLILMFLFINCTNKQITDETEITDEFVINESVEKKCCAEKSSVLNDFIKLLEADNYNIDTIIGIPDTLRFMKWDNRFEIKIDFTGEQFTTFFAKRKHPLKNMTDSWYPNFRVFEICFDDDQTALEYEKKINEIIWSSDLFNDKNYDYVVRNSDRLIYVTCGAKIFEEYAFKYKEKIYELTKN